MRDVGISGSNREIKYWRTAIARRKPSLPLRLVIDRLSKTDKILDYGCGRGFDVEYLKSLGYDAQGYDPYFSKYNHPELLTPDTYDVVLNFYVLNIVLPEDRHKILENIKRILKTGGVAYIAVRDKSEKIVGLPFSDGVITITGTFQKTFSVDELEDLLSQHFDDVNIISKRPLVAVVKRW